MYYDAKRLFFCPVRMQTKALLLCMLQNRKPEIVMHFAFSFSQREQNSVWQVILDSAFQIAEKGSRQVG